MKITALFVFAPAILWGVPALAHGAAGAGGGFVAGAAHPIGGLDHILAMVAVGLLAAQMGGRALWSVPAAFVGAMLVGGLLALGGSGMPMVEQGIVGSVLILGLVIAIGRRLPVGVAMAGVAALALFHGHAHGTEMPLAASGLAYGLGFALSTTLLHGVGIALGLGVNKAVDVTTAPLALRASGIAVLVGGLFLLAA